ncbi:MAG: PEP-CTERM sorting domain-containing protein, partial [Verrucomicrobiales bacterium]|nr:PEP-CTERM sorting domain-containing protein [Verrucomicrobiales bacterium]
QFGNSAIRQFGNSAIRQFGNSAIRQFGNSLNRSLTLALALSAALTVSVRAQWTGDATDNVYGNPANWTNDTVNHHFINPDLANNVQLTFNNTYPDFTVSGGFVYTTTNAFDLNIGANNSGTGPYLWLFTGNGPAFTVDIGDNTMANTNKTLNFGSTVTSLILDFQGNDAVFAITPSLGTPINNNNYIDIMNLHATGSNIGALTKTGAGTLTVRGNPSQTFNVSGPVTVSGGLLNISVDANNATVATTPRITGATDYRVVGRASTLRLYNETNLASTQNVIETSSTVTLDGGVFAVQARSLGLPDQQVAEVHLQGGRNSIANGLTSNRVVGNDFTLTIGTLTRENFATVNFFGDRSQLGAVGAANATFVKLTNSQPILEALIGGSGAAGDKNISILPWATANASLNSMWGNWRVDSAEPYSGGELVTYNAATGFRALADNEYFTTADNDNSLAAAGAKDNIHINSNTTVSTDKTVNAMKVNGGNLTIGNNNTLTVTSGALITWNNISGGTLDSGNNPFIISGGNNPTISSELTNSVADPDEAGLIVAYVRYYNGWNRLTLSGNNTYTGKTIVQGDLTLRNSAALPSTSKLHVDLDATVLIQNNGATGTRINTPKLSGQGLVNFDGTPNSSPNLLVIGTGSNVYLTDDNNSIQIGADGILAPGDLAGGAAATGTLLLGDKVVWVNFLKDSIFQFDIASATDSDLLSFANAAATLNFATGAIIQLNFLNDYTPADGDSWQLATGFDLTSSKLGDIIVNDTIGGIYDLDFTGGGLQLTFNIPEPGTWTLLLTGAALLAIFRRRRK